MKLLAFLEGINEVVKLRGFGSPESSDPVHAFMDDFEAATEHNPLTKSGRLYGNVRLGVYPSRGGIRIGDISVAGDRGEGQGTKALQLLTSLADKHGVKLNGVATAYLSGQDGQGRAQANDRLLSWYVKHGFTGSADTDGDHNIEYLPRVRESKVAYGARFARSSMLRESAGQYVYHAATAADFGSIMQKGLTFFNPSRWVKAGSPDERYQDEPSVFAFEHPLDAWRWAAKMEWEFKEPAVVVKFNRSDAWEADPSDDISLQMGKGRALMSRETIPPSDIVGAKTVAQIGTPVSTGLHGEEYEQHVIDTLEGR